jgi:regulation of enolase protein 1 (concanavalin A-like superfamily)/tetratricopeptide (TPR) repeat protein
LLAGFEHDWCQSLRHSLEQRVLECLHDLTRADRESKQLEQASEWARRAVELDACDELAHRELMELYAGMGEVEEALAQYERCKQALWRTLKAPPDPETLRLFQWLSHQTPPRVGKRRASAERASGTPPSPTGELRFSELSTPLVGREEELARLWEAWRRACGGSGGLILLSGEAGIGKSRLGREFLQEIERAGALTLRAPAYAVARDALYEPLLGALRRGCDLIDSHGLEPCPPVWMAQVARLLPDLQPEEGEPGATARERPVLVEGLCHFFLHLARQRPLCFFVDDLQNADPGTGEFLRQLGKEGCESGLLLLGTYREGELTGSPWLESWLEEMEVESASARLRLVPLSERQIAELLERLCGGGVSGVPFAVLARRLHEESEGNPLIFWELVRQWSERGFLRMSPEGECQINAEAPEEGLPGRLGPSAAVQAVVRQRLSRQGEAERALLAGAAVIGRRFTFEVLQRVTGTEPQVALAGLERLLAAALIDAPAGSDAYDFRHDKIREVVYDDLMPIARQQLHLRVGKALEEVYGVSGEEWTETPWYPWWTRDPQLPSVLARAWEHAEELAWHFERAGTFVEPDRLAHYYYLVGTRARFLSVYSTAVKALTRARELLVSLPMEAVRLAQLGQVVEQLSPALRADMRTCELAGQVLWEYIALSEEHRYGQGIARGCSLMGQFLELPGNFGVRDTPQSMYERAIATLEAHRLREWVVYPKSWLALRLVWAEGDAESADRLGRECLELARAHQDPFLWQRIYTALIWAAAERSDWASLREFFEASLTFRGPRPAFLKEMLDPIEHTCSRSGDAATFAEICRCFEEGYRRANLTPPVRHWRLIPTTPRSVDEPPLLREEFESGAIHPRFQWHGTMEGTRIDRETRPGWMGVGPAEGTNLWGDLDMNAPRLLATVTGDFVAQTHVDMEYLTPAYGGLLLWKDERHFVRLELRTPFKGRNRILMESAAGLDWVYAGRGQCEQNPVWLRIEREADEVRGLCSLDARNWFLVGTIGFPPDRDVQIGLLAIWTQSGSMVWFDQFCLWKGMRGPSPETTP